jgi:hypothetical protein
MPVPELDFGASLQRSACFSQTPNACFLPMERPILASDIVRGVVSADREELLMAVSQKQKPPFCMAA